MADAALAARMGKAGRHRLGLLVLFLASQPLCRKTKFPSKFTGSHEHHQLDDLVVQWSIGRTMRF